MEAETGNGRVAEEKTEQAARNLEMQEEQSKDPTYRTDNFSFC
jgi:hypothetical protein